MHITHSESASSPSASFFIVTIKTSYKSVSYTHLDVYKRQEADVEEVASERVMCINLI